MSGVYLDIDKAAAELCKRKLSFFVKEFWHVVVQDDLVWAPHMDVLCDEIQAVYERVFKREAKEYDLIINIPPGTSKSTICTVMAPAWSWAVDPSLRHITGSYSADLSMEHAVKARDIIRSDKFLLYFPHVQVKKDEDNKSNYKNTSGGQRFATSVGGTVTGTHAHVITIDDPINPKQASSVAMLKEANEWFDKTLPTRKVDKEVTPTILIMQRLSVEDPTGHILMKKKGLGVRHVCLPGELSDNVRPVEYRSIYVNGLLDPVRLSAQVLSDMKTDLGSYNYAGQVGQSPAPEGGEVWQKWIIPIDDAKFPERKLMNQYGTDWDLAYTDDEDNAANAYVTAGKIGEYIYIDDIDWRWMEFPQLIAWMRTKPSPHYIEAKASGKSAKQTLTSNGIPAIEIKVASGDKVARARSVTPTAEAGMVFIRKSLIDKLYHDEKQGILQFPKSKYKDLADALAQCITRLKKRAGFVSSSPTDLDEPVKNTSDRNLVDFM